MENQTPTIQRHRRSDRYHEAPPAPVQQSVPVRQPVQSVQPEPTYQRTPRSARTAPPPPTAVPAPRALQRPQQQPVQRTPRATSPWLEESAPPPTMSRPPKAARTAQPAKPSFRMPWWLTTAMAVLFIGIMALLAAQNLMQANLVQRQQEREAAYQRIVDAHPIYYMDLIERYAAEYNLRPAFVSAIILNESSFRANAESSVGARGLMQLMPDTGEWIAGKLDINNFSIDRLYDAETNIRFGCWYLNYLSKLFRGDPVAIACAYHAGQSTVASWMSDRSISPDGLTMPMENLPNGPTKTYAGRVTKAYGIYDALYFHVFNEEPAPDDSAAALPVQHHLAARRSGQ